MRVSAPAFLRASKLGLSAGSPVIVLKLVDFISLFSDFSGASVPKSYTSVRAWGSYFIIYLRILFSSKDKKSLIIRDRSNRIHIYIYILVFWLVASRVGPQPRYMLNHTFMIYFIYRSVVS